jgi:hypothetical protein
MRLRITQEDSNLAMKFADETVDNTYNRMKYNNFHHYCLTFQRR